jgi:hypothetical protein
MPALVVHADIVPLSNPSENTGEKACAELTIRDVSTSATQTTGTATLRDDIICTS